MYILIIKNQFRLIIYQFYVKYIHLPSKSMKTARLTKVILEKTKSSIIYPKGALHDNSFGEAFSIRKAISMKCMQTSELAKELWAVDEYFVFSLRSQASIILNFKSDYTEDRVFRIIGNLLIRIRCTMLSEKGNWKDKSC